MTWKKNKQLQTPIPPTRVDFQHPNLPTRVDFQGIKIIPSFQGVSCQRKIHQRTNTGQPHNARVKKYNNL